MNEALATALVVRSSAAGARACAIERLLAGAGGEGAALVVRGEAGFGKLLC